MQIKARRAQPHSCHGLFIMLGGSDADCKVKILDGGMRAGGQQGAWGVRGYEYGSTRFPFLV